MLMLKLPLFDAALMGHPLPSEQMFVRPTSSSQPRGCNLQYVQPHYQSNPNNTQYDVRQPRITCKREPIHRRHRHAHTAVLKTIGEGEK